MSKQEFRESFKRYAFFPKTKIDYMTLRKLRSLKSKQLRKHASWDEWFKYLTRDIQLSPTIHERVQEGTAKTLLAMWMKNYAENLPYVRYGDGVQMKIPENYHQQTMADLVEPTPILEIDPEFTSPKHTDAPMEEHNGMKVKYPPKSSAIVVGRGPSLFQNKHPEILAESGYEGLICAPKGTSVLCNPAIKDISDVKIGDKVLAHDGKYHKVTAIFKHIYEGELIRIIPRSIKMPFSVTPEHPILVRKFGGKQIGKIRLRGKLHKYPPCWIRAGELKVGDYIALPILQKNCKKTSIKISTHFSYPTIEINGRVYKKQPILHPDVEERRIAKPTLRKNLPRNELAKLYLDDKLSLKKIAKKFKVSVHCVKGNLYRYGINRLDFYLLGKGLPEEMKITNFFLMVCGYYVAEGSPAGERACHFSFGKHELNLAKDAKKFGNSIGLSTRINRKRPDVIIATVSSSMLKDLFVNWFGKGAENKRIPNWIMCLPSQFLIPFVKGLWKGDGWSTDRSLRYATTSKTLAYQLVLLLAKIGIRASIHKDKNNQKGSFGKNIQYRIDVESDREKLANLLGMPIKDRNVSKHRKDTFIEDDLVWYRLQKITRLPYEGKVYNLKVSEANSYLCELALTHNCASDGGLVPLLDAGVIPDAVVTVDGSPVIKKYFEHPLLEKHGPEIKWITTVTVAPEVYRQARKMKMPVYWFQPMFDDWRQNESWTRLQVLQSRTDEYPMGVPRAQSAGNAGGCAWVLAHSLFKCSPVALIGIDFGYPEGTKLEETQYYSSVLNMAKGDVSIIKEAYKEFYHPTWRRRAFADLVFYHYRQAFLEMQREVAIWYKHYGGTISCVEGGTLFGQGIKCMPFKTFLEEDKKK